MPHSLTGAYDEFKNPHRAPSFFLLTSLRRQSRGLVLAPTLPVLCAARHRLASVAHVLLAGLGAEPSP